ncbi:MAG: calcium-binding protein [Bacteroidota bacterium]
MKLTASEIERIIDDEIVVDCYTQEEVNVGWAIFMEENLNFPFEAEYLLEKKSGEKQWKNVRVVNNETDQSSFNGGEWYVSIELDELIISARLSELRNMKASKGSMQALQVWNSRNSY